MERRVTPGSLRRCELSTPGWSERMISRAATCGADLVFLDLEDSVAPAAKAAARATVVEGLRELDWGHTARGVRINGPGSEWAEADLESIIAGAGNLVETIIVPKVRSADDVRWVDERLEQLERGAGLQRTIRLEILIEDVAALLAVDEIARSSERLTALIFGSGDMAAAQGVRTSLLASYDGDPWAYHRARIIVAARAAGLMAIDGPSWSAIDDIAAYRAECRLAATLGYAGKWAIHPSQIAPAHEEFSPTAEELAHARRVIAACKEAAGEGRGAIALDGVMVDAVDLRLAETVTAMQQMIQARAGR
jgi:citrate lyase subunit beta / citryl-CoA lyase